MTETRVGMNGRNHIEPKTLWTKGYERIQ